MQLTGGVTAVAFLTSRYLRGGGRRTVAFVLLVGLAAGVVLASAVGARRTQTAVVRLADYSRLPDISFFGPLPLVEQASRLPAVAQFGRSTYAPLSFVDVPEDERERLVPFVSLDGTHLSAIERPIIVAGRLPRPDQPYEIAVSEKVADRRAADPGAVLRAQTFLPEDVEDFTARGPIVRLRVTGVVRQLADLTRTSDDQGDFVSGEEMVYLTPAFWRAHVRSLPVFGEQSALMVRLRDADEAAGFRRAVLAANGGELPGDEQSAGFFSPWDQAGGVTGAVDVEATALYGFAALTGLAFVAILGQAVARRARAAVGDYLALTALGLSSRQMVAVGFTRDVLLGLGAALVAAAVAIAASPLLPIGLARRAEPDPGLAFDTGLVAAGAAVVAVVVGLMGAVGTLLAVRAAGREPTADSPSRVATTLARVDAGPSAVIGTRFALEPGRGPTSIPARTTLAGAVLGAAAVAAALTFAAGFDRVLGDDALQGAPWDIVVATDDEDVDGAAALGRESRVDAFAAGAVADATLEGQPVVVVGIDSPRFAPPTYRGRLPQGNDEVALTRTTADAVRASIGDRVEMDGRRLRVVGLVPVAAQLLADRSGAGVMTTYETAKALAGDEPPIWMVRWDTGVDEQRARDEMQETFNSTVRPFRSSDVRNLSRVSWLPYLLAGAIGLLSVGTLVHALISAVRRRDRDLAILKTMGLDRRQVRRTIRWQASTVALIGALAGIPAGVAAGRWAWRYVGEQIGVVPEPVVPRLAVALISVGVLALANVVADVPARAAARTRPAVVLRTE